MSHLCLDYTRRCESEVLSRAKSVDKLFENCVRDKWIQKYENQSKIRKMLTENSTWIVWNHYPSAIKLLPRHHCAIVRVLVQESIVWFEQTRVVAQNCMVRIGLAWRNRKFKSINLWFHSNRPRVGELTKYERNTTTNCLFTIKHGQFAVDEKNNGRDKKFGYKFFIEVERTLNCFSLNDTWLEKHHVFSTPFSSRWRKTQNTRIIIKQRLFFLLGRSEQKMATLPEKKTN